MDSAEAIAQLRQILEDFFDAYIKWHLTQEEITKGRLELMLQNTMAGCMLARDLKGLDPQDPDNRQGEAQVFFEAAIPFLVITAWQKGTVTLIKGGADQPLSDAFICLSSHLRRLHDLLYNNFRTGQKPLDQAGRQEIGEIAQEWKMRFEEEIGYVPPMSISFLENLAEETKTNG